LESSLKSANVAEEEGDGRSYGPLSLPFLEDLVGVDCVLAIDEPQNVAEDCVDEGVGIPESKLWPNSSWEISEISVNSVKVDVVDPTVEGAGDVPTLLRNDCLGTTCSETRPGTRFSRSSISIPNVGQLICFVKLISGRDRTRDDIKGVLTPEDSTNRTVDHTTRLFLFVWATSLEHHDRATTGAIVSFLRAQGALGVVFLLHLTLALWNRFQELADEAHLAW